MRSAARYRDYKAYLKHQPRKTQKPDWKAKLENNRSDRVAWFMERFAVVPNCLGLVLCLGARHGEEVEALWKMGLPGAIGLDLAPHPPWVRYGDMNKLDYPDTSVDMVYTNAFDHCWRPKEFIAGIERVLKPEGLTLLHLAFSLGDYETHVPEAADEVERLFKQSKMLFSRRIPKHYDLTHEILMQKKAL